MITDTRRLEVFQSLHHNDRSGRPKYQRLADVMVEAFRKGIWRPGDQLPAEEELTTLAEAAEGEGQQQPSQQREQESQI